MSKSNTKRFKLTDSYMKETANEMQEFIAYIERIRRREERLDELIQELLSMATS